jgi:hypothetical protein
VFVVIWVSGETARVTAVGADGNPGSGLCQGRLIGNKSDQKKR